MCQPNNLSVAIRTANVNFRIYDLKRNENVSFKDAGSSNVANIVKFFKT